jgi:mannosyltransferase
MSWTPLRSRDHLVVVLPALVMFAIALWKIDGPSYWRDESVSVVLGHGSLGQLRDFLNDTDAVHGLYYLFLHVVTLFGTSETVTRLPSAVGAALAAGGIAVLGRRWHSPAAGLYAGLTYALLPIVSRYAQEARQYTLVSAGAVLVTYLLVRALERPRVSWFASYGAAVALLGWLHLYSLFLLTAHAVTVLIIVWQRRPTGRGLLLGWALAVLGALTAVVPLALIAHGQEAQVSWLRPPGPSSVLDFGTLTAGGRRALALVTVLAVAGIAGLVRAGRSGASVAVPWLVVPFAVSVAISQVHPVYHPRYVLYCVCALALLTGAGLATLTGVIATWARPIVALAVLAGLAVLVLPAQSELRKPGSRPDDLRSFAGVLRQQVQPGDAVLYVPVYREDFVTVYADAFRALDGQAFQDHGTDLPPARFRAALSAHRRIWVVENPPPHGSYRTPAPLANLAALRTDRRFVRTERWKFGSVRLTLFTQRV